MLTAVKKNIQLIFMYFKFNLSSAIEYRTSFLLQTFGMILNNSTFIFFWWVLFNNINHIGGYGFEDVMTIWAISSTSYGISFILFGNTRKLARMIINGELDSYLLQPKNVLLSIISSSTIISAWGDFFYGIILYIIIIGLNPLSLLLFLFFCITSSIIFTSVLICVHSLTFFIGNSEGIGGLYTEFMITFSIYPESIYKGFTKIIIFTILPAAFISFIPLRLIHHFSWSNLIILLTVVILWIILSFIIFYKGLKRYESGNLIINKL